jgi:hypothetical protein
MRKTEHAFRRQQIAGQLWLASYDVSALEPELRLSPHNSGRLSLRSWFAQRQR